MKKENLSFDLPIACESLNEIYIYFETSFHFFFQSRKRMKEENGYTLYEKKLIHKLMNNRKREKWKRGKRTKEESDRELRGKRKLREIGEKREEEKADNRTGDILGKKI